VKVLLSPEARKMLRALARRRKLPMGEYLEALIREEHRKG
jgi:DNA-binding transcriptional ArsR family regulator